MYNKLIQPFIQKIQKTVAGTLIALFAFIALLLLPCVFITTYANSLITQKIRSGNEIFFSSVSSSMDDAISAANNQISVMIQANSSDYYTLLYADSISSSDTTIASYHLFTAFRNCFFNPDFFSSAFLYFSEPDFVITPTGSYNADTFFSSKCIFQEYHEDYFPELMNQNFNSTLCPPTSILTKDIGGNISTSFERVIPVAIHPAGSSSSNTLLILFIDEQQINETFHMLNSTQSCYVYLMHTITNELLNRPSEIDYAELLELDQKDFIQSSGTFSQSYDHDTYRISWQNSSVSRLRYIFVEPKLLITKQLTTFLLWTICIVLITIVLIVLLYHIITHRLQRSFAAIFHRMGETISSSHTVRPVSKEFDISSLKEAVELLCNQYENNQPYLITSFIGRLLQETIKEAEIQEFCNNFHVFSPNDYFCLLVIRTNFQLPEQYTSFSPETRTKILSELHGNLQEYGYVISLHSQSDFVLFLSAPTADELTHIQNQVEDQWDELVSNIPEYICGRSLDYQDIRHTYRCYHQVLTLLEQHGIREEKKIYSIEDMLHSSDCQILQEEKKKIQALSKHASTECYSYIQELLTSYKNTNASFSQYRIIILELLFLLQQILYECAIPFSSIFPETNVDLVSETEQLLLSKHLDQLCLNAYRRLSELKNSDTEINQVTKTLLNYIDEHLADINLTTLADVTGMSQNYLSQYFKKHFGVTFLDYVTHKKINRAKEELINTTHTCKAIGESLGYYDPNVFIRNFKKLENVTPNEYRKLHSQNLTKL